MERHNHTLEINNKNTLSFRLEANTTLVVGIPPVAPCEPKATRADRN